MCKESKQKIPRNILIKKEPAKTEKAFVSAARKKKREKWKRKNIKTNLLLSKVNSSGQTINRELHRTQLDRGLTMTWVPLLRHSTKENTGPRRECGDRLYSYPIWRWMSSGNGKKLLWSWGRTSELGNIDVGLGRKGVMALVSHTPLLMYQKSPLIYSKPSNLEFSKFNGKHETLGR